MFFKPSNIAICIFILFGVTYLLPNDNFPYEKVVSPGIHILATFFLFLISFTTIKIGEMLSKNITLISNNSISYKVLNKIIILCIFINLWLIYRIYSFGFGSGAENILEAKEILSEDSGGITIVSNLHIIFFPLFILKAINTLKPWKLVTSTLLVVLFVRGILNSERLAFFEVIIPLLVVLESQKLIFISFKKVVLFALAGFLFFFTLELSRSFYSIFIANSSFSIYDFDLLSLLEWGGERFYAYYSDCVNKFYFSINEKLFGQTNWFLYSPIKLFDRIFDIQITSKHDIIQQLGVAKGFVYPGFTNPGGFTQLVTDFGLIGGLLGFIFSWLIFSVSFIQFKKRSNSVIAILFPILVVNFLELLRFNYVFLTRFTFPFVIFLLIYYFPKFKS